MFPVGILRPPVFHPEYPPYLNYGSAGYVVGHEMGHSFDKAGHAIAVSGQTDHFWDNATEKEYMKRQVRNN